MKLPNEESPQAKAVMRGKKGTVFSTTGVVWAGGIEPRERCDEHGNRWVPDSAESYINVSWVTDSEVIKQTNCVVAVWIDPKTFVDFVVKLSIGNLLDERDCDQIISAMNYAKKDLLKDKEVKPND